MQDGDMFSSVELFVKFDSASALFGWMYDKKETFIMLQSLTAFPPKPLSSLCGPTADSK